MKIVSIFPSINGEVCREHQGSLTTFIRTFGCNANPHCSYCDTKYSYGSNPFQEMRVRDIVSEVKKLGCKNVTITGGEPLIQRGTMNLIYDLAAQGFVVSIETNGTVPIPMHIPIGFPRNILSWVVDYKLPSSGCEAQMNFDHYRCLGPTDFVKFVVSDEKDFLRALDVIPRIRTMFGMGQPKFAFSPMFGEKSCSPETLAQWVIENELLRKIGAIYSLQIHKILNVL